MDCVENAVLKNLSILKILLILSFLEGGRRVA